MQKFLIRKKGNSFHAIMSCLLCVCLLVTFVPSMPAVSAAEGQPLAVFTDDFNDGNADDWDKYGSDNAGNRGVWAVNQAKEYSINGAPGAKTVAGSTYFTDLVYEADLRVTGFNSDMTGVLFRTTQLSDNTLDGYNGYFAAITVDKKAVLGRVTGNNEWKELGRVGIPWTSGKIKVVAVGNHIQVYVNDMVTPKIDVIDDDGKQIVTGGAIGLRTWWGTSTIDNIKVREYSVEAAASPQFSLASGSYETQQTVAMTSATPDAVIRYTLDGSEPNAASPVYTSPFVVTSAVGIKAYAEKVGHMASDTVSALYVIAASTILLEESFEVGNAEGWTTYTGVQNGAWSVVDGRYNVQNPRGDKAMIQAAPENFVWEGDINAGSSGQDNGLVFRVTAPGNGADRMNGYYVGFNLKGFVQIGKMNADANNGNGSWMEVAKAAAEVYPNQDNHLKIIGIGTTYYVYVNGKLTTQFTDADYTAGTVGIRAWNDGSKVSYDNLKLTGLTSIAEQAAPPVFEPQSANFAESQQVVIASPTEGAVIYYTTDGSEPTHASAVYNGPITVTETTTVKAIAGKGGLFDSAVRSGVYTKTSPGFSENFEDGNADGWSVYGGTWNVSAGKYSVNKGAGFKAVANGTNYSNFVYEADIQINGGAGPDNAGLIFRVSNPSVGADNLKGYYAGIGMNNRVQVGRLNNNWTELASIPFTVKLNTVYRMKVVAEGRNIEVYINDEIVVSVVDRMFTEGAVGIRSHFLNTSYDNLLVTDTGPVTQPTYDWSWVKGAVFVPTNVVNQIQQWNEYDHDINDRELSYAHDYGINFVRVFVHNLLWENDKEALLANLEDFLQLADKYDIKVELVFFDDCWNDYPVFGPQQAPRYGAHNSRWVEGPGDAVKSNYGANKQKLKEYVQGIVNAHKDDPRIAFWNVYNEPSNGESGLMDVVTKQIMNDARIWIKETGSTLPISSTGGQFSGGPFSDFITWHPYESDYPTPFGVSKEVLADELMNRLTQTLPGVVENYGGRGMGYVIWELGIGRSNTRFPWGSDVTPLTSEPEVPFHGIVYPDGHPWDVNDVKALLGDGFESLPVFNVQYYKDDNFSQLAKKSITTRIDFDLGNEKGTGSPDPTAGIGEDHFSIRWTGTIMPEQTGEYTLYADSDNIAKVWVNGEQVIDKTSLAREEVSAKLNLIAGQKLPVKIEYVHATGDASLHLKWSAAGMPKQAMLPIYSGKSVESVAITPESVSLKVDQTKQLIPVLTPVDASKQEVLWSSDKPGVAVVSASGVVKGVSPGTATITVTTVDGGKTATAEISVAASTLFQNPIVPVAGGAGSADPSIVFKDGYYYYVKSEKDSSLQVAKSKRLQDIGTAPRVTVYTPPSGTMYSKELWAPELQYLNGKWYIYFAADDGNNNNHRMYVLEGMSQDPQGEYAFKGKIADATDKWAIDGSVLVKDDQTMYFVWSGWEGDVNVRQNLYIAPMSNPWTISGPRVLISTPDQAWELNGSPFINEGPEVLKKNGKIFIVYSASGSWTDDYTLGMLTNTDGDVLNASSWTKSGPVFSKVQKAYGPGHNTFTTSPDGTEDWIVYHATLNSGGSWANRSVRAQKFTWNPDGTPNFGTPVAYGEQIEQPSGTPAAPRYKLEAEDAVLGGTAKAGDSGNASGGKVVGHLDAPGSDYVEFNVNVQHAGDYNLVVMADNGSAGGAIAKHAVKVNGGAEQEIAYKNFGWNQINPSSMDVTLQSGINTIRLAKKTNFAQLDSIILTRILEEVGSEPVTSLRVDQPSLTVTAGDSAAIVASVRPIMGTNKNVIVTSSNPEVAGAAVTSKDTASGSIMITVNGLQKGTAQIKVVSADNDAIIAESTVIVRGEAGEPNLAGYTVDQFDNTTLDSGVWSIFQESAGNWSLTQNPGSMTIHTTATDVYQDNNSQNNVFLRNVPGDGDFEIVTKVTAPIAKNHQQAGLFIWQNADNFIKLAHVWVNGSAVETAYEINRVYQQPANQVKHPGGDTMTLKIRKIGDRYTTYYWDGYEWIQAAAAVTANLTNIKIGFFANNIVAGNDRINAKFEYFAVRAIQGGVDLAPKTLTLEAGETSQLTNLGASGTEVIWTSSNPDIAAVNAEGLVEAKTSGRAVIKAVSLSGDFSGQAVVNVREQTPPPSVLFEEDFTSYNEGSWGTYGGEWKSANGVYSVNAGTGYKSVLQERKFTDFKLEADVKIVSGNEAGLIFRASGLGVGPDALEGYYLGINAATHTAVLGEMSGGKWKEIASKRLPIFTNVSYKIKVIADQNHIQVFINDNPLNVNGYPKFDLLDSTHVATGFIGFRTWNANAEFDNVKVSSYSENLTEPTYTNSLLGNIADPFVLSHEGMYYLYGTNTTAGGMRDGFKVYTSEDLVHWSEHDQLALSNEDSWGSTNFWAPEVIERESKFYMYYVVEEHLAVATSDSPLGPFVQDVQEPMHATKEIDAHIYTDEDGKTYIYFVRFNNNNEIWVAELNDDMKTMKDETLQKVFSPTQEWELSQKPPVAQINEGPFVIKHNGTYYMTYSGNHFQSPDYGVGYATAPTPTGPWTKYEYNPIMKSNVIVPGAGHHSLVYSPDGTELFMVYHTHYNVDQTEPRKLAIDRVQFVKTADGLDVMEVWGPTITPQLMPSNQKPPVEVPVLSVEVTGEDGATTITENDGKLQLHASVLPEDATDKSVAWAIVSGEAYATISSTGLLSAAADGTVIVKAVSISTPAVYGTISITVTGQTTGGEPNVPPVVTPPADAQAEIDGNTLKLPAGKPNGEGLLAVAVSSTDFNKLLAQAAGEGIHVEVRGFEAAKEVSLAFTDGQLEAAAAKGVKSLTVDLGLASFTFNPRSFTSHEDPMAKIVWSVSKSDTASLPAETKALLGNKPLFDFKAAINGVNVTAFSGEPIKVMLDYDLQPNEDPNLVVVYYINESGKPEIVKNAKYIAETGKVAFTVSHFSKYAALHKKVIFSDLAKAAWARTSIEALAAREMINGVGDDRFAPSDKVTRAQFITMLMRALSLSAADATSSFTDLQQGAWYYEAVAAAQKLGIVQGKQDGSFGINEAISREEMAVMAYRAAKAAGSALAGDGTVQPFVDQAQISAYAAESVAAMQQAAIINGKGNDRFAPKETATRAEAAKIIYSLFQML